MLVNGWFLNAPFVCVAAILSIALYVRGWRVLRRKGSAARSRFSRVRLASFLAAWCVLLVALASPLDVLAERTLSAHMVQHILLTMIAPPLFWLALPAMPMLFGVGRTARISVLAPILSSHIVRKTLRIAGHPLVGWIALALATVAWHMPAAYTLALGEPWWHRIEHASMLAAGLLFWLCVIAPFPYRNRWPRIALLPYLVAADLVNTAVSAYLAFAGAPVYRWYAELGPAWGTEPLLDQQLAAGLMWIPGSVLYLGGAIAITVRYLVPQRAKPRARTIALHVLAPSTEAPSNLLNIPLLGRILRSARARLTLRCVLLLLAGLIVWDGMAGPSDAPMNLAGTFPWTHWRGVVVIAMLALGNVACMACPLLAPRTLLRKWIAPTRIFPRALRSKWMAVSLVVLWLVAYEAFDLWSSPLATAMIILGFFVVATAVDLCFTGASFCRYVCPLGQYQMVLATVSVREVRVMDASVCARCETHDCLKGRVTDSGVQLPGCGLDLYLPKKSGNLDCTFCLDCVSACPHDNIGVLPMLPGADLARAQWRSQIGLLAARLDFAVLAAAFAIGAIANAAGMTAPVVQCIDATALRVGCSSALAQACFVVTALMIGVSLIALVASTSRTASFTERAARYAFALIPLGASVWFAHFMFHFVTGFSTAEASTLRVLYDLAWIAQEPDRIMSCCAPAPDWLLPLELLALSFGLAISLGVHFSSVAWMLAKNEAQVCASRVLREWIIGAVVLVLLWAIAAWILLQPMEMRGTTGFA